MSGVPASSKRFAAYALLLGAFGGAIGGVVIGIGLATGHWPVPAWGADEPTTRPAMPVRRGAGPLDGFDLDGLLEPRDEIRSGGPRKDGIPSIVDPAHVAVAEVDFLEPDDRVVGVTIGGATRAYPIRLLNYHEIVNDVLGGVPIAVVYCPLCDSVSVVDRRLDDETLEFGVSGLLLYSNVLMYDRTHDALWTQVGGRAISGPVAGRALTHLNAWEIAPFGAWSERHPAARVVSFETGHRRDYRRAPYERYFDHDRLSFPVPRDDRLPRQKVPVVGVRLGDDAWAVPVDEIERAPGGRLVVPVGAERVVLLRKPGTRDVAVLEAPAEARVIHTFWFAWAAFHPKTVIYGADDRPVPLAHPGDWASPETLARAVYAIVSGPAGAERDWDRYRALFRRGATFSTFSEEGHPMAFGVEEYIEWYGPSFLERGIFEREVEGRTERSERVAQRWGTCEYRWRTPDAPADGRSVVIMQFVQADERWWITSLLWQPEAEITAPADGP